KLRPMSLTLTDTPTTEELRDQLQALSDGFEWNLPLLQAARLDLLRPAFTYLSEQTQKHQDGVSPALSYHVVKMARLWNPSRARLLQLNAERISPLTREIGGRRAIPWMTEELVGRLTAEAAAYSAYVAEADGQLVPAAPLQFSFVQTPLEQWRAIETLDREENKIPTWRMCFRRLLLLQPSAACVER